jgi:UDP-N-acetylmuramoylalanine--D-glutamate ligase
MGLGRHGGGVAAASYLAGLGAQVTVTDLADRDSLNDSISQLTDRSIARWRLGGHDLQDFLEAEVVVVNPAVRPDNGFLRQARQCGAVVTSETELFLSACPARVIGVTGSNGKSTSCAMLAEILHASGMRTWLGGNIGHSLLGEVDAMSPNDWVVLELSSFQLAHLGDGVTTPQFCLITGCTPNHLEWHADLADYTRAKQRLVREQGPGGICVWDRLDRTMLGWDALATGTALDRWPLERIPALRVPGLHNRINAARVAALAEALGVHASTIGQSLAAFRGLPHRIEWVGEVAGRRFYDDSKSTTPEATMAALDAVAGPKWWLAGGLSKGVRFEELARQVVRRCRGAAVFGSARNELALALRQARADFKVFSSERLDGAMAWSWRQSSAGEAVVLSPACASLDQFRDFAHRGRVFRRWVRHLDER